MGSVIDDGSKKILNMSKLFFFIALLCCIVSLLFGVLYTNTTIFIIGFFSALICVCIGIIFGWWKKHLEAKKPRFNDMSAKPIRTDKDVFVKFTEADCEKSLIGFSWIPEKYIHEYRHNDYFRFDIIQFTPEGEIYIREKMHLKISDDYIATLVLENEMAIMEQKRDKYTDVLNMVK